jgi:hypothetical protein
MLGYQPQLIVQHSNLTKRLCKTRKYYHLQLPILMIFVKGIYMVGGPNIKSFAKCWGIGLKLEDD